MATEIERARISFRLVQDQDGYPPADVETLWAIVHSSGSAAEYEIDNIPFFVRDISLGDRVRAKRDGAGLWYESTTRASGNTLLRIIVEDDGQMQSIRDRLRTVGCSSELSHLAVLAAVDVPSNRNLDEVLDLLEAEPGVDVEVASMRHRSRRW